MKYNGMVIGAHIMTQIFIHMLNSLHIMMPLLLQYIYGNRHGSQPCLLSHSRQSCRMGEQLDYEVSKGFYARMKVSNHLSHSQPFDLRR
jgi:hypothetical protein